MNKKYLKVFTSDSRIKLIKCLSDGSKNVSTLINNCGISQSAVSQHLAFLKKLNIVSSVKEGRERNYKIIDKQAEKLAINLYNYLMSKS